LKTDVNEPLVNKKKKIEEKVGILKVTRDNIAGSGSGLVIQW
jgi:hypothetical protein